jgi:hypothetical protein
MSFVPAGAAATMRVMRSFSTMIYALVVTWPVRTSMRRPARMATGYAEMDFSAVDRAGSDCGRELAARSVLRTNTPTRIGNFKLVFTWAPGS